MDELRKENKITFELRNKTIIKGKVLDFIEDRVLVKIDDDYVDEAYKIEELTDLYVTVDTHFGIKNMFSCVISELNQKNEMVIENNEAIYVEQKREYVRANAIFDFEILDKDKNEFSCKSVNISAGGISFNVDENCKLNIGDDIIIKLHKNLFEKEIECCAKIVKITQGGYAAQFIDINPYDQDKVTKYVFKLTSKK